MASNYRNLLKNIGEDPTREGLLDTPMRFTHPLNNIYPESCHNVRCETKKISHDDNSFIHIYSRAAKALNFFTKGYQETLGEVVKVTFYEQ